MFYNNYNYIILNYTKTTTSISLVVSTTVLFTSLMQSVKGAPFLNINFLLALFAAAPAEAVFGTVTVSLTSITHHYNQANLTLTLKF